MEAEAAAAAEQARLEAEAAYIAECERQAVELTGKVELRVMTKHAATEAKRERLSAGLHQFPFLSAVFL